MTFCGVLLFSGGWDLAFHVNYPLQAGSFLLGGKARACHLNSSAGFAHSVLSRKGHFRRVWS